MRSIAWLPLALCLVLPTSASALVITNYGDFVGTGVTYENVSEDTFSPGDPSPLFGAPVLSGNELSFTPPNFLSSSLNGTSDSTLGQVSLTARADMGATLDRLMAKVAGTATLLSSPPPGNAGTNAIIQVIGTVTITEQLSGPIAPVVIPFSGAISPDSLLSLPDDAGTTDWMAAIDVDIASVVPDATVASLLLNVRLDTETAGSALGIETADSQVKDLSIEAKVDGVVNPIPEPGAGVLYAAGLLLWGGIARRGGR